MWQRLYQATPTSGAVLYWSVGTIGSTPAVTDTSLGSQIPSIGYTAYVVGYPTFDSTNQKVTSRGFLNSAQANGSTIQEVGEWSSGAAMQMFSHDVFTSLTKNGSTEVAFIWSHNLT